jgi:hypothetical protein
MELARAVNRAGATVSTLQLEARLLRRAGRDEAAAALLERAEDILLRKV